ncbi:transcriptional regulator [Sodalis sp. RH24]|uniref:transcriptional regulator n=1 Tax=unclassified Sodalis (in: enterobacteria) TaxID=2636512 RepID=UPI0039B39344
MNEFWDALSKSERAILAEQVKTSPGYLRLVFKGYKKAGFELAQKLEEVTGGTVTKADLRPDIYGNAKSKTI